LRANHQCALWRSQATSLFVMERDDAKPERIWPVFGGPHRSRACRSFADRHQCRASCLSLPVAILLPLGKQPGIGSRRLARAPLVGLNGDGLPSPSTSQEEPMGCRSRSVFGGTARAPTAPLPRSYPRLGWFGEGPAHRQQPGPVPRS
jgi:hypothetical protein